MSCLPNNVTVIIVMDGRPMWCDDLVRVCNLGTAGTLCHCRKPRVEILAGSGLIIRASPVTVTTVFRLGIVPVQDDITIP